MSSKRLSMIAVRQQRRGTALSKRKSAVDEIITVYPSSSHRTSSGSGDLSKRLSWVDKVRNRSVVLANKGRIVLETLFTNDLRGIFSLRFAADGNRFVVAYGAGAIQVWYADTDTHCVNVKTAPSHGQPVTTIRFLPKVDTDNFFAAGSAGVVMLCGMNAGDYHEFARESPNEINALDVDADGDTVATVGRDATIRLYDVNTKKMKLRLCRTDELKAEEDMAKYHRMRVFALRFHPGNKDVFITGGWDDSVKIWDARVKSGCAREFRGPHICGDALDIRDNKVLTGSWVVENALQLWDFGSGKLIDNITPINRPRSIDGEFLYCCQFFAGDHSGNTVVCGGSGLNCVEVIDVAEKRVESHFKVHKSIQAIDTTSKFMVFGGMETVFKVAAIT